MSDRETLHRVVNRITQAAHRAIDDPKNTAKGDHWRELDWHDELMPLLIEENEEVDRALIYGDGDPLAECGDELVVRSMMLDKAESEDE